MTDQTAPASPVTLETDRLILRPWTDADFEPFAAMSRDPRVMEYFMPLPDRNASDALAVRFRSLIEEQGWGFWAVEEKAGKAFTGCVGLAQMRQEMPVPPGVEIGWRLAHAYWGKGYATEASKACLEFGFTRLNLPDIVAYAAMENVRSRAVMERIGLRPTDIVFDHPDLPEGDPRRSHCFYRITASEWQAMQ